MGREIRKVPPNWNHPKQRDRPNQFQPMYDETWESAVLQWNNGYLSWINKSHESYDEEMEYWEYDFPPKREYYRPWKDEEATWYQCWETVSEGTPVTPPFETLDELCEYLAVNGDFWDQARQREKCTICPGGPWGWDAARAFIKSGHVCSMMTIISEEKAEIYEAKDIALKLEEKRK